MVNYHALLHKENSENDEEHNDENGEENEEENDENALEIVYSGIRIWCIDFPSVKWSDSGYISILDNLDIRSYINTDCELLDSSSIQ